MARNFPVLKNHGFTLIEIIVVAGIIAFISAVVFVNTRSGDKSLALERAAYALAQDVRSTSERALNGQPFSCGAGSVSGYGMYFDENNPTTYIVYANCNGEDKEGYQAPGGVNDDIVQTVSLGSAVEIASVSTGNVWSVAFFPPYPKVAVCGNDPCNGVNQLSSASLVLHLKNDTSQTKTITINEKGAIDID